MTHYLRFDSEEQAREILSAYVADTDGTSVWMTASHTHALDPVGVIHKPTGETIKTEDGPQPVFAPLPGYHVNFIGDISGLEAFEVFPGTPSRVFA